MGEHRGIPDHMGRDPGRNTATTLAGPLARLLDAPNFVNYQVEHHIAAIVPGYKLPALHKILHEWGYYAENECLAESYWVVIHRCVATNGSAAVLRTAAHYQVALNSAWWVVQNLRIVIGE